MLLARPLATLLLAVAPLAAQGLVIQPAQAGAATESRTLPLAAGSTLKVKNVNGFIKVEAWDRAEVQFTGDFKPSSRDEHVKVVVEPGNRRMVIRGEYPKSSGWRWMYRGPECQMTLKVPRDLMLELDTVNGEVTLRGTSGSAEVGTVNGAIRVEQVRGAMKLETVNGAIQGWGLDNQGKGLDAETVNGGIDLQVGGLKGHLNASTVNGGVSFSAKGAEQVEIKRNRVSAVFPGGNESIRLSTVNGAIRIQ